VKDKYGSDAELADEYEDDSEEDESEDEDGEELTLAMDVAILKTLAKIKNKDPEIYDSSKNVFEGSLGSSKRCARDSLLLHRTANHEFKPSD
jgi:hypothetical protein